MRTAEKFFNFPVNPRLQKPENHKAYLYPPNANDIISLDQFTPSLELIIFHQCHSRSLQLVQQANLSQLFFTSYLPETNTRFQQLFESTFRLHATVFQFYNRIAVLQGR